MVHPCSLASDMGDVEFIRGRCVHWVAPWGSSGSYGVAGFIDVRPEGCQVHPVSLDPFLGVVGFVRGRWVHSRILWGTTDSFWVAGLIGVRPWVVGFIWGR